MSVFCLPSFYTSDWTLTSVRSSSETSQPPFPMCPGWTHCSIIDPHHLWLTASDHVVSLRNSNDHCLPFLHGVQFRLLSMGMILSFIPCLCCFLCLRCSFYFICLTDSCSYCNFLFQLNFISFLWCSSFFSPSPNRKTLVYVLVWVLMVLYTLLWNSTCHIVLQ